MKKLFVFSILTVFAFASVAMAQDLDSTSITDQFNVGARGNETGTGGSYGASNTLGTEFSDYSGADSSGGPISYINTYAGASSGDAVHGESPVLDVTNVGNPDRALLGNIISPNSRPGATDGGTVVLLSDDGGTNCLIFGENDDANYYVEADVYCYDQSGIVGDSWAFVAARACRDEDNATIWSGAFTVDREASYLLAYDYTTLTVGAYVIPNDCAGFASGPGTAVPAPVGTQVVTEGWHTLRVEADSTTITYSVDGTQIAQITDVEIANGRGALGFRETGVTSASERAGTFDNLKAGPVSAVGEWNLY